MAYRSFHELASNASPRLSNLVNLFPILGRVSLPTLRTLVHRLEAHEFGETFLKPPLFRLSWRGIASKLGWGWEPFKWSCSRNRVRLRVGFQDSVAGREQIFLIVRKIQVGKSSLQKMAASSSAIALPVLTCLLLGNSKESIHSDTRYASKKSWSVLAS
jgi:hypothetical protein